MNALEPAEARELSDAAGVMTIGLDAHGGEGRSDVARRHHRDGEALADQPIVKPLREASGFETDMLDAPALAPGGLGERLRLTRSARLLDDAAAFVDDAEVRLVERHIETDKKLHGLNSLIGCDAGEGPDIAAWRKARSAYLRLWFMAAHIVTRPSNGISALQLPAQLGLGGYKTAWLLLQKLRRAMIDPDRSLLEGVVEIDETGIPLRRNDDPPAGGQGRSPMGKMLLAGAVELSPEGRPRRIRLAPIADVSAASLRPFVGAVAAFGATVITEGWSGYLNLPDHAHAPKVVGRMAAHVVLRWTHRVFSNLKRWGLGVFHGLRRPHLQRYLDEFVWRWSRRRHAASAFDALLGIGARLAPATARDFVDQRV